MANKVTFHDAGRRLSEKQLRAVEDLLCPEAPGRFPLAYRRFLLKHNGGRPEPAHFKMRDSDGKWESSEIYEFLGIDPGRLDGPGIVRTALIHRSQLPRYALPIADLDLDDLLLLFTAGPREGQVWRWSAGGAERQGWKLDPENNIAFVCGSFARLLKALHRPASAGSFEPIAFALDSPRVRGKRL